MFANRIGILVLPILLLPGLLAGCQAAPSPPAATQPPAAMATQADYDRLNELYKTFRYSGGPEAEVRALEAKILNDPEHHLCISCNQVFGPRIAHDFRHGPQTAERVYPEFAGSRPD